jgi:hypothetical protein
MSQKFKAKAAIALVTMLIGAIVYFFILDPYSKLTGSSIILIYRIFRSESILLTYAGQLEMRSRVLREPGEPARRLPVDFEDDLINTLHNGSARNRHNIIKFYAKVIPFTYCCWRVAKYEDKTIIGDVFPIARKLNYREKLGVLELVESLRRDLNQEMFKESLNAESPQDIDHVLQLYETWWQSPLPLQQKLQVNPLERSPYFWRGP